MQRKIAYWGATGLVTTVALFGAFNYLTTAPEAVENFRNVGYTQQLRVLLGIAKLAGAIVLLLPRLPTLKEWAYAGVTFAWVMAFISAYSIGEPPQIWSLPLVLLALLIVSYVTGPVSRRLR